MKTINYLFAASLCVMSCTTGSNLSTSQIDKNSPLEKAKEYNFNFNQANNIVNYTTKNKKARQKISEENRAIQNDKWYRLNSTNKNPDKRNEKGQFRFYRNN